MKDQKPKYRFLKENEIIEEGDECCFDADTWVKSSNYGFSLFEVLLKQPSFVVYRRKIK